MLAELTPDQHRAATEPERDVLVTAGAGSGKTRTLVARYLCLLDRGLRPSQILAITFTEKAALEMRSRVRAAVSRIAAELAGGAASARWAELEAEMEAARISTIHSFCAELLRAHPAEAGIDPRFGVIDEAHGAALKGEAIEAALARALADSAELPPGLTLMRLDGLRSLLAEMLPLAPEMGTAEATPEALLAPVRQAMAAFVERADVRQAVAELDRLRAAGRLLEDAGPALAPRVEALLAAWDELLEALAHQGTAVAAQALFRLRREHLKGGTGKATSRAKGAVAELKALYDAEVDPWLGGRESADPPPDPELETLLAAAAPWLSELVRRAAAAYHAALDERHVLDFDDLEIGAVRLLSQPAVRERWRQRLAAVLVDEFQDTNARQNAIVAALCGERSGSLFVVGDARQSIYRFRGADVTVFRRLHRVIDAQGGLTVTLDRSFRTHHGLLRAFDALLAQVMGTADDGPAFEVPYQPLRAEHATPGRGQSGVRAPYIELILGGGADAEAGRRVAAGALAERLWALRAAGEIREWSEVALLFRASTGFAAYEAGLEAGGIPSVTVAGRGFYDRPEIRDVLGLLRGLAEPWNDAAVAGLLRSPAVGLSDAALFRLRWPPGATAPRPLRLALAGPLDGLSSTDQAQARRARRLVDELAPQVDRLSVAELLKRLIDATAYRAVLATLPQGRPWRNLDKLLEDAHQSGLVRVGEFFEYLAMLREVGAREGEAGVETAGAVQLMTVHKAKGLEFPVVVLADAGHRGRADRAAAYLLPDGQLAVWPAGNAATPLAVRWAHHQEELADQAETRRLLYVAATRAQDKLLVSGHVSGRTASGWLAALLAAAGDIDWQGLPPGEWRQFALPGGEPLGVWLADGVVEPGPSQPALPPTAWPTSAEPPLWSPLSDQLGQDR
jgi:ATP-dependent helicase/nuclease subunit A